MIIGNCWRCEMPGHVAAECQPEPAETKKDLAKRIDRLVERWQKFDITRDQKRTWIAMEIKAFEKARAA